MGCCNHNNPITQPLTVGKILHGAIGISKVLAHIDLADEDTISKRRDLCRKCEYSSKHDKLGLTSHSVCSQCHCIILLKTQAKSEHCPLLLW